MWSVRVSYFSPDFAGRQEGESSVGSAMSSDARADRANGESCADLCRTGGVHCAEEFGGRKFLPLHSASLPIGVDGALGRSRA